ncbi:MAG: Tad domain-containing protein [Roseiflexaceae bacterium]|nr:Tad domain-containing protein [Roseiflexaceae bacterium]
MRDFQKILHDERGGIGLNLIWVCFIILFMVPFFWDVGSVHYARRFASTGSDAGALAAAQEYARQVEHVPMFNGIWYGRCELGEFTPQQVVLRYRALPAFGAPAGIGQPYAAQYASANRNSLTSYNSWPDYGIAKIVTGVPIPAIRVQISTDKDVATAYDIYGREFKTPNKAQGVAFLDQWTVTPRPCPGVNKETYDFTFRWKITLDKARD